MPTVYSQWSLLGGNDTTLGSKNYPMTYDRLMRILLLPGHSIWSRMGIVGSNEALSLGISWTLMGKRHFLESSQSCRCTSDELTGHFCPHKANKEGRRAKRWRKVLRAVLTQWFSLGFQGT